MFSFRRFFLAQKQQGTHLTNPATGILAISASPNEFLEGPTRGIYCTTAGTIDCVDLDGNITTALPVSAGFILPLALVKVTAISSAVIYALR